MTDFHQHWWLVQPARTSSGSISNAMTISSALHAVEESYTRETSLHKKRRLLEIIVGAPASANDVLEPEVVQVRGRPSRSTRKSQPSKSSMRRIPSEFETVAASLIVPMERRCGRCGMVGHNVRRCGCIIDPTPTKISESNL